SPRAARRALVVWAALLILSALTPFEFEAPAEALRRAPERIEWLPFLDYFERTDLGAVIDWLTGIVTFLPVGCLVVIGWRPATRGRASVLRRAALAGAA